jgi:replication factor A1
MQTKVLALERSKREWTFRGRPRGKLHSFTDIRLLEYLAKISVKHGIEPREFFAELLKAFEHRESKCKKLTIVCRRKTAKASVFLITTDCKVVAQLPISTHLLEETDTFEEYGYIFENAKRLAAKKREGCRPASLRIEDVKPGMNHIDLKAKVLEIPKSKMVYTRFGTPAYVSNVLIADETGSIRMSLWNQQINMISKGDLISIIKGKVASFGGELQLRIGRSGRLNVIKRMP